MLAKQVEYVADFLHRAHVAVVDDNIKSFIERGHQGEHAEGIPGRDFRAGRASRQAVDGQTEKVGDSTGKVDALFSGAV